MKKTILTFGFISGAILSGVMLASIPLMDAHDDLGMIIGYSSMVLAFLLTYFGVRSYRENVAGGVISFGRAFAVGISITAIACCCYVATWEVVYNKFMPDFMDKYVACQLDNARKAGKSPAEIEATAKEMEHYKELYKIPLARIGMTFLEPLPVGLLMTLLAAGLLRKKQPQPPPASPAMA